MADHLDIEKRKKGDIIVLELVGRFTLGEPEQYYRDTIADLISRKQTNIVLNMEGLEFMDSSGVGAMVKSYTTLIKIGGKLKLLKAGKFIQHSLKITGLLGIFELYDDEASALNSFLIT
jgi:anti-anti-sigma factor